MIFENWALKTIFHLMKSFLTRNIVSPPQKNVCARDSLRTPGTHFFSDPTLFKNWDWRLSSHPGKKGGRLILCTYTHFDVNIIYKNKNAGQLLLWIWIDKNKWMSDVTKSPTSTKFLVLVLITFLLKIDIIGLAMLI